MASSVYWSNDHMVNEIKTNPQLFKEFSFHFNEYKKTIVITYFFFKDLNFITDAYYLYEILG